VESNQTNLKNASPDEILAKTKKIYLDQHSQYLKDKDLFNRFYEYAVSPQSYNLESADFLNAKVLDAGCGNSAYFQKAMHDLGAAKIYCMDLGTDWINRLSDAMAELNLPDDKFEYKSGSTTDIPYDDNIFDFVASNGVLMHLPSQEDALLACKELYRVLKPGGNLYIYFGVDKAGIVDKYIVPALRKAYQEEGEFRHLVDNCDPDTIKKDLAPVTAAFMNNDTVTDHKSIEELINYITLDTCTFLKNMLQVPVQQGAILDYEFASSTLANLGAVNIRKCPNYYFKRKDIRRFLTPFHVTNNESNISRIFYGGGHLKVVCRKPA
jgi:ubiquinone/menaquinone biosynthesis C-methylase UbiE